MITPLGQEQRSRALECAVYYHIADEPWLSRKAARGGLRGALARWIPEWGVGTLLIGLLGEAVPQAVAATEYLRDGQLIARDFEVIATPGHTPGHTSFYIQARACVHSPTTRWRSSMATCDSWPAR